MGEQVLGNKTIQFYSRLSQINAIILPSFVRFAFSSLRNNIRKTDTAALNCLKQHLHLLTVTYMCQWRKEVRTPKSSTKGILVNTYTTIEIVIWTYLIQYN